MNDKTHVEQMLRSAQLLRDSGILIFERLCWNDHTWEYEGKTYRRIDGCGSHFRWLFGMPIQCCFCGWMWLYPEKVTWADPNLFPLTSDFTGSKHELTETEVDLLSRFRSSQEVTE